MVEAKFHNSNFSELVSDFIAFLKLPETIQLLDQFLIFKRCAEI